MYPCPIILPFPAVIRDKGPAPVSSSTPAPTSTAKRSESAHYRELPLDVAKGLLYVLSSSVQRKLSPWKKRDKLWSHCDSLSMGWVLIKPLVKHLKFTEVLVKLGVKPTNDCPFSHSWTGFAVQFTCRSYRAYHCYIAEPEKELLQPCWP